MTVDIKKVETNMANNPIGVAVVGAGYWGPNLIRNFHNHDTSVVRWVVDRSASRLDQIRKRFRDIKVSESYDEAFADSTVDAVVIATPTTTHHTVADAALQADKHVLVEKPIASTSVHSLALCELAKKRGKILMVGHVFVYNLGIQRVGQYIKNGDVGGIHYIAMDRTNLGPIRMDVNAAWDLASHDISIVNFWLGCNALSVSAIGGSWINQGIQDAVFATLRYPGNVIVNLRTSWLNPSKTRQITVVGEKRMLTFDDMNMLEPIRIYDKGVTDERVSPAFIDNFASFRASIREGDVVIPKVFSGEPLRNECEHFIDCVTKGNNPASDGHDGLAVVRVLEAMDRSMANFGREENVDA